MERVTQTNFPRTTPALLFHPGLVMITHENEGEDICVSDRKHQFSAFDSETVQSCPEEIINMSTWSNSEASPQHLVTPSWESFLSLEGNPVWLRVTVANSFLIIALTIVFSWMRLVCFKDYFFMIHERRSPPALGNTDIRQKLVNVHISLYLQGLSTWVDKQSTRVY